MHLLNYEIEITYINYKFKDNKYHIFVQGDCVENSWNRSKLVNVGLWDSRGKECLRLDNVDLHTWGMAKTIKRLWVDTICSFFGFRKHEYIMDK